MYLQDVPTPRFVASDRLFRPTDEFSSSRVNVPCHQREALGALPPSAIVILFPGTGKERRDAWLHPEIRKPHSPATDLSCGVALSEALASQHTRGRESRPETLLRLRKQSAKLKPRSVFKCTARETETKCSSRQLPERQPSGTRLYAVGLLIRPSTDSTL
ncbi:hypothetical protein TGGT1_290210 [Toxoplasma gondii GT1]|uniref:Uncharacterized protein n=1 Tax=Toxoplasma gondii (strain ATCC 50853 / GT1) TaxID=507601 RepID=S7UPZ4_TOXGG|nr:hypothetical protein TGGT1_290210 [Toxoplasma gondii GT1]